MDKLYIRMHDPTGPITDPAQLQQLEHNHSLEARKRCMQVLLHAVNCRDPNCTIPPCQTVRFARIHLVLCKRKRKTRGCPVCEYARQCIEGRQSWLACRAQRNSIFVVGISMGRRGRSADEGGAPSTLSREEPDDGTQHQATEEQTPILCLHDYCNVEV